MTGFHSASYQHQLDCEPSRFDNDELIRRYQAGEFLYHFEKRDARIAIEARAKARKVAPVEIVAIAIPVLAEAVAVAFAIGVAALWIIIFKTGGINV